MRVVIAVSAHGKAWRIHVDLEGGCTDVFCETAYVAGARYVPDAGWCAVDPDVGEVRDVLAEALKELRPFDAVMRRTGQP